MAIVQEKSIFSYLVVENICIFGKKSVILHVKMCVAHIDMEEKSLTIELDTTRTWFSRVYFIGIGGIGMSALARYYMTLGFPVAGYDRTPSSLTRQLETLGISISYQDERNTIPESYRDSRRTLVVRTPAVPDDSDIFSFFRTEGFRIHKRAEVLGWITKLQHMHALCVAGTHGKTTISTMLAHLLYQSEIGTNAFLGGISMNYGTNLLIQQESNLVVVEADEYDRSFLQLSPYMAVVTSTDADHLDIYGTLEAYRQGFSDFTALIEKGGVLLRKQGIELDARLQEGVKCYSYGIVEQAEDAQASTSTPDFYADSIVVRDGAIYFDFHAPQMTLSQVKLGVPVWVNIENAVAAMAVAWLNGVTETELRLGVQSFRGTQRRFNTLLKNDRVVLMDDYAHHPEELRHSIESVRRLYSDRKIVGIFQPHLYTRTRDFYEEFAQVLSQLDSVVLLPIYPAREEPIEGVSSGLILDSLTSGFKILCQKEELNEVLANILRNTPEPLLFITLGAGDIDRMLGSICQMLKDNMPKTEETPIAVGTTDGDETMQS